MSALSDSTSVLAGMFWLIITKNPNRDQLGGSGLASSVISGVIGTGWRSQMAAAAR
jgi:hypothetical protein